MEKSSSSNSLAHHLRNESEITYKQHQKSKTPTRSPLHRNNSHYSFE